jgi:thiamine biosynthesis lipoprotein
MHAPAPVSGFHFRMKVRFRGAVAMVAACLPGSIAGATDVAATRFEYSAPRMGTLIRIVLYAPAEPAARAAAAAAFTRISDLNRILSDYDPESEVSRLSRHAPGTAVPVSAELFALLEESQRLAAESGGAFDITAGPIVRLWRHARQTDRLPAPAERAAALRAAGHAKLKLRAGDRTVTLLEAGMMLDFGGIAKGYAADAALAVLRQHGFSRAMVAAGGDLALGAPPPGATGWRIELAPFGGSLAAPLVLVAADVAVSTSGDAEQYLEFDGVRYSHIVDPRTALGLTHPCAVTIIAGRGAQADGLATAGCVLAAGQPEAFAAWLGDRARAIVFRRDAAGRIERTTCGTNPPGLHSSL